MAARDGAAIESTSRIKSPGENQEAFQKALSDAADMLRDAKEGLSRQQHELARGHNESAWSHSGLATISAGSRAAQGPFITNEAHSFSSSRPH